MNNQYALVARLFNEKRALVEPDYEKGVCRYRYLTQEEIAEQKLNFNKKYTWREEVIYLKSEGGETLVFITIDATPIVLNKF